MDGPARSLLRRVVEGYAKALADAPEERKRLAAWGVGDATLIERHSVGFVDGTLPAKVPRRGEIARLLRELGLLDRTGRETFAGSIAIPVLEDNGDPVQIALYDEAGRLRWLFDETPTWWNAACLTRERDILVVPDPLAGLRQIAGGRAGVIAPGGPGAPLGPRAKELLALHKPRLTIDGGDATWKEALAKQIGPLRAPDERIIEQDANGFTVEFPKGLRFIVQGIVQDSPRHLRASVKVLRPDRSGRIHLDTLDLYHAKSRLAFARTAACLLSEDPAIVEECAARVVALAEEFLRARLSAVPAVVLTDREREEAMELLRAPDLLDRVLADIAALGMVGEATNAFAAYVCAVSRKLDEPLSVLVVSRSGAGKSTLADMAAMLAPPEDVLRFTRLTPQTLFYQKPDALSHKLVIVEEAAGAEDAAYALRILQSSRRLSLSSAGGHGEARTREVRGPVSIFVTTTRTDTDEETAGRFLVLSTDESEEQTRRILEAQRWAEAQLPGDRTAILRRHQNAQRLLRSMPVVNPFAPQLSFHHARLSARRDQKKYLLLIRAVALVHQHQRKIEDGAVVVEPQDIEIAGRIADEAMGQSLYDLSPPSRRLLLEIRDWRPTGEFSQRELREKVGWKKTQLAGHVKELVEAEYLVRRAASGQGGRRVRYVLDWDGRGLDGEKFFKATAATSGSSGTSGTSGSRPAHFRSASGRAKPSREAPTDAAEGTSGPDVRPSAEKKG